jgi:hypothetical protein
VAHARKRREPSALPAAFVRHGFEEAQHHALDIWPSACADD